MLNTPLQESSGGALTSMHRRSQSRVMPVAVITPLKDDLKRVTLEPNHVMSQKLLKTKPKLKLKPLRKPQQTPKDSHAQDVMRSIMGSALHSSQQRSRKGSADSTTRKFEKLPVKRAGHMGHS